MSALIGDPVLNAKAAESAKEREESSWRIFAFTFAVFAFKFSLFNNINEKNKQGKLSQVIKKSFYQYLVFFLLCTHFTNLIAH
jgi:hypothetical protein